MMIKLRRGAVWDSASIEIKERKRDLLKKPFLALSIYRLGCINIGLKYNRPVCLCNYIIFHVFN